MNSKASPMVMGPTIWILINSNIHKNYILPYQLDKVIKIKASQ